MEITKSTYIDALQRMKIVSSTTRNNCVDRMIFTVKDLEQYLDYRGKISIKGFSVRSINELQNAWDKACASTTTKSTPTNKPRKLVRILSTEEKSTISELESLFESTYLGGCTSENSESFVSVENIKEEEPIEVISKTILNEEDIEEESSEPKLSVDTSHWIANYKDYLSFIMNNRRRPSLDSVGNEFKLAQWFDAIISLEDRLSEEQADIVRMMREGADSFFSDGTYVY